MKKKITILSLVLLVLLLVMTVTAPMKRARASSYNKYEKGHTGLHGKTTMQGSNFVFELSGPYWYKNIDLYLETWNNESDYTITLNGEQIANGTISEGKTHFNYTLPTDKPVNLAVEIDGYRYEFRNKLITERSSDNWKPPDQGEDAKYSESDLTMKKIETWGLTLLGVALAFPPSYYIAKIKREGEIQEVIE